jgi:hypothetical protein
MSTSNAVTNNPTAALATSRPGNGNGSEGRIGLTLGGGK